MITKYKRTIGYACSRMHDFRNKFKVLNQVLVLKEQVFEHT